MPGENSNNRAVNNSAENSSDMKWPPKLNNSASYDTWKRDIEIWCDLTDLVETKRALAIHLSLQGKARDASSEVPIADLKKTNGVEILLAKLDKLFLPDKGRRQFNAFNKMYNLRREDSTCIPDFVSEFEHHYFVFKSEEMTLPDPVMAFMLLASCDLNEQQVQLVMSAINPVSYDNMKSILLRVFGSEIGVKNVASSSSTTVKIEPVFQGSDDSEPTMFGRYQRGRGRGYRGRGAQRGRGVITGANREPIGAARGGRKHNPTDREGKPSRCFICESTHHWVRDCPHSYENGQSGEKDGEPDNSDVNLLALFVGYSSDCRESKVQTLLREAKNSAVLDTGCSKTVCGLNWLNGYQESLSEFQRAQFHEEHSDSSFTFGDGNTYKSMKRVRVPCYIGKKKATITMDVVECDIPLLLSINSMKRAEMSWNFMTDTIAIGNSDVNLRRSTSGHYVLPLSM